MPDERWNELFAALRSNRDRAILALGSAMAPRQRAAWCAGRRSGLGRAARAGFPQGHRRGAVVAGQPGGLRVDPAVALVVDAAPPRPRRRAATRRQPMNYEALRAVFKRVNALLGTNYARTGRGAWRVGSRGSRGPIALGPVTAGQRPVESSPAGRTVSALHQLRRSRTPIVEAAIGLTLVDDG
jgi:hypothetical protein